MNRILVTAALAFLFVAPASAETVKVTLGHMCCGVCKDAAMASIKSVDWADQATIEGTTLTVTSKADKSANVVALLDGLAKSGFPAREITVSGPVKLTIAHLCCPGCVGDLKTNMAQIRNPNLDKDNIKVDATTKTVIVQPMSGKELNLVAFLRQLQQTGFAASAAVIVTQVARK